MSKRNAKKIGEEDEGSPLDMTSMIDVVFLLLIFFMCATKFKLPEGALRSYLPRNKGGTSSTTTLNKGCRMTLSLIDGQVYCQADEVNIPNNSAERSYYEDEYGLADPPSPSAIEEHIQRRKDTYGGLAEKGLPVIIDFREDVPWKYVVDVLNICHKVQIEDISFAAPEIPID